jgi:hypothetical protein
LPRRLIYASRALADLDAMQRWQTQPGSGRATIRRVKAIRLAILRLKQHPCRYPAGRYPGARELHFVTVNNIYEHPNLLKVLNTPPFTSPMSCVGLSSNHATGRSGSGCLPYRFAVYGGWLVWRNYITLLASFWRSHATR